MPRATLTIEIEASCAAVFALIHDYGRRLAWDTMLSDARLLGGATSAGPGARSVCTGTWRTAFLALETEYVSFEPGRVAAVKLVNRPPFFQSFAASIRHEALGERRSRTTYTYSFRARPAWLRPLIEPVIDQLLRRETRMRLEALRRFLER
jgi:hypothetical protein